MRIRNRATLHLTAGFTLVELMVALVIVSLLTTIIYGLFIRTSDALTEVDSLADTMNKARFAIEHVRNDLQAAGAQATPNSDIDPWIRPRVAGQQVMGIFPYSGWQDQRDDTVLDGDVLAANPNVSFDGLVVMGAYDYPQSFLIAELGGTGVTIPADGRGLYRMIVNNPFFVDAGTTDIGTRRKAVAKNMQYRLLKVNDRDGYGQFIQISNDPPETGTKFELTISAGALATRAAGDLYGIEATAEGDERYEAALIDAYWYHVTEVPGDPGNFQLVRERIDAGALLTTTARPAPRPASIGQAVVITDRVVDFQVWFDCVNDAGHFGAADGGVYNAITWPTTWETPDGSEVAHDCVDPDDPSVQRARVGHIRLSLRTQNERANRPHLRLDGTDASRGLGEDGMVQTFDVAPQTPGAARVVTVQTSVEMTNFALRDLAGALP